MKARAITVFRIGVAYLWNQLASNYVNYLEGQTYADVFGLAP